jgi:flagellar biosynthetic protein FliR
MPIETSQLLAYVFGFALVATRVTGAFYFVPIPGIEQVSWQAKTLLILGVTFSLFTLWPTPDPRQHAILAVMVAGMMKEATIGLGLGLIVMLCTECLGFCFHLVGLQAGFTFASTIDPSTQADSPVLEVMGRTVASLLFFTMGLHHAVIRAFAASLQTHPAGTWALGPGFIEPVIRLFQVMLSTGLRLALPVIVSMVLIDVALALIGRVNSHIQLLHLAFPVKLAGSLILVAWIIVTVPSVFSELATHVLNVLRSAIGA